MRNHVMGKTGAAIMGLAVLSFAVSMIFGLFGGAVFTSCLSGMLIALGFMPFMVSLAATSQNAGRKAAGCIGAVFAAIYAALIFLVYYAECSAVKMNAVRWGADIFAKTKTPFRSAA